MERIVYLLGAGFSAPLGLPVISNFLFKSKEMFANEPEKYPYFEEVFDTIKSISVAKSYYDTNVFNIEDILSILEMADHLNGQSLRHQFKRYIVDVIEFYTPPISPIPKQAKGELYGNWSRALFGPIGGWNGYGHFVCSLLNLAIGRRNGAGARTVENYFFGPRSDSQVSYSVVTLNYDCILERVCDHINSEFPSNQDKQMNVGFNKEGTRSAPLAKLHGTSLKALNETEEIGIVPPTWSKGGVKSVLPSWVMAHDALANATQLRILGYSLPVADAYIKYLLKSAVMKKQDLKKIDVICRDDDGNVERRFREFIKFDYLDFFSGDIATYLSMNLQANCEAVEAGHRDDGFAFTALEKTHADFMNGAST